MHNLFFRVYKVVRSLKFGKLYIGHVKVLGYLSASLKSLDVRREAVTLKKKILKEFEYFSKNEYKNLEDISLNKKAEKRAFLCCCSYNRDNIYSNIKIHIHIIISRREKSSERPYLPQLSPP